jgi:hypothetical protein
MAILCFPMRTDVADRDWLQRAAIAAAGEGGIVTVGDFFAAGSRGATTGWNARSDNWSTSRGGRRASIR